MRHFNFYKAKGLFTKVDLNVNPLQISNYILAKEAKPRAELIHCPRNLHWFYNQKAIDIAAEKVKVILFSPFTLFLFVIKLIICH